MLLGQKAHTAGNKTRYEIDYSNWLEEGVSLSTATVALDTASAAKVTDVTISGVTVELAHRVVFFVAGGSVNETFTVDVQIVNSRTETKNDTAGFVVVAP